MFNLYWCVQGVVYQLDAALQDAETQRAGLVFVYDMTDSKYTNFDYELSQKILTMLKVSAYILFYINSQYHQTRLSTNLTYRLKIMLQRGMARLDRTVSCTVRM